jgi:hypothetical protein
VPLGEALAKASAYAVQVIQSVKDPTSPEIVAPPEIEPPAAAQNYAPEPEPSAPASIAGVNLKNVVVPKGTSRSGKTWSELTAEQIRLANGPQNEATEQAYQAVLAELADMTRQETAA